MEFSPQVQEEIRKKLEQARAELETKKEELKREPGNEEGKKEVAEKLGLISTLLLKYELGVIPSPKEALELFERLEANLELLPRIVNAIVGAAKALIEGVISIVKALVNGIRSLFPTQDTQTAYLPDSDLVSEGVVTFAMLAEMEATGMLVVPAVFSGTAEAIAIPYVPSQSTFSVRVQPVSPSRACLHIESLASTSHAIEHEGLRLPPFLQSLDPRRPSIGMLDLESGELSGQMYSRLTDGVLYTVRSPILVRSTFTGRMHFDSGILRLRTQAIDFAGDLPFRRVFQPRLRADPTVLLREGVAERLAVPPRLTRPIVPG